MIKRQAHQRINKLKKLINRHRYLYHVLDRQEISEDTLDSLKKELFDLEQKYPEFVTPDSPTQRIGGKPLEKFEKVEHRSPMLSFNDAFSEKDMKDWEKRIKKLLTGKAIETLDYFAEPKIDGLAVTLIYKKGILVRGATRGDGRTGEDVTKNLKTIESIPLLLKKALDCEVRGEVYITKKDFEKLNQARVKKDEQPYANPRNTAAGAIRQLDPRVAASRRLSFLAWQLLGRENQVQEYEALKALGFKPVDGKYCRDLPAVFSHYSEMQKKREKFLYQIDGIVVSVNNNKLFKKLGIVGKAPRAAIAYKFPLKQAETVIENIWLQVGRTGAVTPVAHLKPVEVGGVTITRATLHNEDEIKRLGVKIGDTVIVGRAGDVIPDVVKVLKELRTGKEKEFKMPKKCPVCVTPLVRAEGEVIWRCPNPDCGARQKRYLEYFVSKSAFDIDGLGTKIIEQLLQKNLISDAGDLFELKEGDLVPLERFAEKSAQNLIGAIQAKKSISLARFIYALGIKGVGAETAVLLAQEFCLPAGMARIKNQELRIKEILQVFQNLSREDLESVKDIGPVASKDIYDWFRNKNNVSFLERLDKVGIIVESSKVHVPRSKLKGKTFVLTGTLKTLTRETAKEEIRNSGGNISESISKKTDFLVVGGNPGSKLTRAKKLGIKTITEQEFLRMLK